MSNDVSERIRIRSSILSCTRCSLHSSCKRPVPFSGDNPNVFAILGEAPGSEENDKGAPFIGPSGRLLRSLLGDYASRPSYVNAVCCFPNRTPTKREVDSCAPNLTNQLRAISPLYLMACGGIALQALGFDVRVGDAQGRWFWYEEGTWVLANWHPSAVLRSGLETKIGREFNSNVVEYVRIIQRWDESRTTSERLVEPPLQLTCIRCGRDAMDWDRNRTGWCDRHTWTKGVVNVGSEKKVDRSTKKVVDKPVEFDFGT